MEVPSLAPGSALQLSEAERFKYDQLRKEILHNDNLCLTRLHFTIIAFGAVCGGAVSAWKDGPPAEKPYYAAIAIIFLTLTALAGTGAKYELDRLKSTFTIATYLRVFVERERQGWEGRLAKFREETKAPAGVTSMNVLTYLCLGVASSATTSWSFLHALAPDPRASLEPRYWGIVIAAAVVAFGGFVYAQWKYGKENRASGKTYLEIWQKISASEHEAAKPSVSAKASEDASPSGRPDPTSAADRPATGVNPPAPPPP